MSRPQVEVYTIVCLLAIKLMFISLEALLHRYLSAKVTEPHQKAVDHLKFRTDSYYGCLGQLERIQLDLEKLAKLRSQDQGQHSGSHLDDKTPERDPGDSSRASLV